MEYLLLIIGAVLVNNVVLVQFLGICPFLGVSTKLGTAMGMAIAVIFVMALATTVTFLLHYTLLVPLKIEFLQTLLFILVIAALVQMVELILKKVSRPLYQALGVYLPLITTNCAILGIAVLVIRKDFTLLQSVAYAVGIAVGFGLALLIFAGIREKMALYDIPEAMKGAPIALVTAGLMSLAFMGFAGMIK
ncbi:MAG: electron transport complex subunit RsxA [Acidobacteria bacterium]|jgi:electron transport complex protein RnfA|nr:electron transport complex subunit RsxA [Acidobacteriota bacterium]